MDRRRRHKLDDLVFMSTVRVLRNASVPSWIGRVHYPHLFYLYRYLWCNWRCVAERLEYHAERIPRASPRSSRLDCPPRLRHQIAVMMSSGAHVIIERLHLPNAYGALGPYIKDGGSLILQSHLLPSLSHIAPISVLFFTNHPT